MKAPKDYMTQRIKLDNELKLIKSSFSLPEVYNYKVIINYLQCVVYMVLTNYLIYHSQMTQ